MQSPLIDSLEQTGSFSFFVVIFVDITENCPHYAGLTLNPRLRKKTDSGRGYPSLSLFSLLLSLQGRRGSKGQLPSRSLWHQMSSSDSRHADYMVSIRPDRLTSIRCCSEPCFSLHYDIFSGPRHRSVCVFVWGGGV